MPIRMQDDDPRPNRDRRPNRPNRPDSGGGGLSKLLPFILLFIFRKPKLLIPLLIIGAVWYFFLGGQETLSGGPAADSELQSEFSFGATLDQDKYDEASVYEPLTYGTFGGSSLPASMSLLQYAPERLHQGRQGSCVGWASSYAARTILYSRASGRSASQVAFSPSYLYNQIALSGCQGAYMLDAMEAMRRGGVLPFRQYPYSESSCSDKPDRNEQAKAQQFRIKGYNRLTLGANRYEPDINGIRQHLAQGAPVVIGMQVGGTFMHDMRGQSVWRPTRRDYSGYGFSGHAMCVTGYDDNKDGGAFQIMNSWGKDWGRDGVAWVRYDDFRHFVKEAYGLYPEGASPEYDPGKLSVEFGLVNNATQSLIPLRESSSGLFRSVRPIGIGEPFKVAVANSVECYIYVFGQEVDGSSYVLFPYTSKHSAYCGITGTRVFPREQSMVADNLGQRDRIAVVVSKSELDYEALNRRINSSSQSAYNAKLRDALRGMAVENISFQAGESVSFSADLSSNRQVVGMVIELDKQ